MTPAHIGIVGVSAEGAALCYRTICVEGAQYFGPDAHPEVSMHTYSFDEYRRLSQREDWAATGELMLASAQKLAAIGADFLICPANTPHLAFPHIAAKSPLPWLHIAGVVADEAKQRGFRRIGVLAAGGGQPLAEDRRPGARDGGDMTLVGENGVGLLGHP